MFKLISALLIAAALTGCASYQMTDAGSSEYVGQKFPDWKQKEHTNLYKTRSKSCSYFSEVKYIHEPEKHFVIDCDNIIVAMRIDGQPTPPVYQNIRSVDREILDEEYAADEPNRRAAEKARLKAEKEAKAKEAREKAAAIAKLNATGGFVGGSYISCDQANRVASSGMFSSNSLFGLGVAIGRNRACAGGYYGASISGSITNTAKVARKDATVVCSLLAKSGTVLGTTTKVVYEKWAPSEQKDIWFNVQAMPNVESASCRVTSFN